MKKMLLLLGVFVFLLVGLVSAVGGNGVQGGSNQSGGNDVQVRVGFMEQNQVQAQNQVRVNLTGLSNAQLRVRNEDTQRHLEQVWSRIQLKDRNRLGNLSGVSVDEVNGTAFEFRGVKDAKLFGLFNVNKRYTYSVSDAGKVNFEKRGFDFLYRMEE